MNQAEVYNLRKKIFNF